MPTPFSRVKAVPSPAWQDSAADTAAAAEYPGFYEAAGILYLWLLHTFIPEHLGISLRPIAQEQSINKPIDASHFHVTLHYRTAGAGR